MKPGETLAAISKSLEGLEWYVFGAQAAVFYGSSRATFDIDITVAVKSVDDLVDRLADFEVSAEAMDLARVARALPSVHKSTGISVDFVIAGPGLEAEFLSRCKLVDLGGVSVPIISPEDLIVSKILAGRAHDIQDARAIVEGVETLDTDRIRNLLRMLDEALGQSDLLAAFEAMVSATKMG